jgi:signal transduction histidine kinase
MAGSLRLDRRDWLGLVAAALAGAGSGFLLLLLLLRTVLEPQLLEESVLRISRNVRLVEAVLRSTSERALPDGVITRHGLSEADGSPRPLGRFDRRVMDQLKLSKGLEREIRRDQSPLQDPLGGYWIALRTKPPQRSLWLYQPERLSSLSVWYLPVLRSAAIVLGMLVGIGLFLRLRLELPFRRVMAAIPDTALPPLALLPERGIAPLRLLTVRINRLLERLNSSSSERRLLLRGLAHDFGAPQTRLMLQAELLRDSLEGHPRAMAEALLADLRRLAVVTDQLGVLADGESPSSSFAMVALDEFCGRLAASYSDADLQLRVPRLLVQVDPVGLERSLCNLIDNALEYGRPPLLLAAGRRQQQLWIRLDDHGPGLATPTLLTMPSPPRSDDRERSRHQGLGLQLVERFCRSQGGRLLLQPAPGGGLRAELQLEPTAANPLFQPS